MKYLVGLVLSAAFVWSGCAASQAPSTLLTRVGEALEQAEESGAQEHAPLELRTAQQKLEKAKQAVEKKKNG